MTTGGMTTGKVVRTRFGEVTIIGVNCSDADTTCLFH
jgi:hypothetical protein